MFDEFDEFDDQIEDRWYVETVRLFDIDIWVNGIHFYVHDPVIQKFYHDAAAFYRGAAPWTMDAEYSNIEIIIDEETDLAVVVPVCFLHSIPTNHNTGVTPLSDTWGTLIVREIFYSEYKE